MSPRIMILLPGRYMKETKSDAASCVDLEKQIFDLKQVLEISKSLNSTLDYTILISSILDTCMGQMMVIKAGLFAKKGLDSRNFSLHRNFQGFDLDHKLDYIIPDDHPTRLTNYGKFRVPLTDSTVL